MSSCKRVKIEPKNLDSSGGGTKLDAIIDHRHNHSDNDDEDDDDDDDLLIVEPPVVTPLKGAPAASTNFTQEDGDVQVVGTLHTQLLPHMRPHCTEHTLCDMQDSVLSQANVNLNLQACHLCYCYVCDVPAKKCIEWTNHCGATDKGASGTDWKVQRAQHQQGIRVLDTKVVFHARYKRAQVLKRVFLMTAKLGIEGVDLQCTAAGIGFKVTGKNVILDFFLLAAGFDTYQCDMAVVSLNFEIRCTVAALTAVRRKTDALVLTGTGGSLTVQLECENATRPARFALAQDGQYKESAEIVNTHYPPLCTLPTSTLQRMIQTITWMDANVCTFSLDWDDDRQKLTIQAVRPRAVLCRAALHLRSCANTLDQANPTSLAFDAADTTHWFTFTFPSRLFYCITRPPLLSPSVSIRLKAHFPMKVEFNLGEQGGYLHVYLAYCGEK